MGAEHPRRRNRTARDVAERLGISVRTVRNVIAEPREDYENRAKHRRERIIELHKKGWTYKAIATELDMHPGSICAAIHHLRKAGRIEPAINTGTTASDEEIRVFHDDEKHTWKQTAEHFGISTATAKNHAYRARRDRAAQAAQDASPDV